MSCKHFSSDFSSAVLYYLLLKRIKKMEEHLPLDFFFEILLYPPVYICAEGEEHGANLDIVTFFLLFFHFHIFLMFLSLFFFFFFFTFRLFRY